MPDAPPEQDSEQTPEPEGQAPKETDNGEEPFDKDRAMELINKLRRYERGEKLPDQVQSELDSLRQKVKEHEDAQKTEAEKASERTAELERENATKDETIRELRVRVAFVSKAAEVGTKYPDKAFRLLDLSKVEFDKAGEPTNLGDLLDALKADVPELFQTTRGSGDGGARPPTDAAPDMEKLLRMAARKD